MTIISDAGAGATVDVGTRIVAESLGKIWGQTATVINHPGANGSIGTGRVARAAPDGYTLIAGTWSTFVSNGALYPLRYNLVTDFEPVSLLVSVPYFIVAKKTVPVLGAAGFSLVLAGGAAATTNGPPVDIRPAPHTAPNHEIILGEEEISDVSLATFHVFDRENPPLGQGIRVAAGGCGHGCGGGGGARIVRLVVADAV